MNDPICEIMMKNTNKFNYIYLINDKMMQIIIILII